jgi:hypothetical protein
MEFNSAFKGLKVNKQFKNPPIIQNVRTHTAFYEKKRHARLPVRNAHVSHGQD